MVLIPDLPRPIDSSLRLEILDESRGSCLGQLDLGLLSAEQAQALLLANLSVEDVRLWIRNGHRCQLGNRIPASTESLEAELRIAGCPLGAFAVPAEHELVMHMVTGSNVIELERATVSLTGSRVVWRSRPVSVHGSSLLPAPGGYTLQFTIGGREIARAQFRVLNEAELIGHVRVAEIQTEAETRGGARVPGLRTLRWEEHQAFWPTLQLENGVLAPNTLVRCIARVLQGTSVLRREEFVIRLDRGVRQFRLQRIELGTLGLRAQPKPARLVISICIGGEVKGSAQVLVLPPERITNFEGQLTFEANELPFDESEYEQIAQRLGFEDEGAHKRGPCGWIRALGSRWRRARTNPSVNTGQQTSHQMDPA